MTEYTVNWPGASGHQYKYWASVPPLLDEPGNYIFARQLQTGHFQALYVGVADSLRNRFTNHERLPEANRLGMTHLFTHTTPGGEAVRLAEEKDLIQRLNPPLNTQHKNA